MPQKKEIRVATRPSKLATTQTRMVVEQLEKLNPDYTFKINQYSTKGDRETSRSLTSFGGTGLFVKELENVLLSEEADIAIHSLKDVPSHIPEGLKLVAFPQREDPRDVLIAPQGVTFDRLPHNATIGTGSPRRILQLKLLRNDLQFKEIRGNIDTRLFKLEKGLYDGIILATAGLKRIDKPFSVFNTFETSEIIPAIGQGILAVETRKDDPEIEKIVLKVNHEPTMYEALAERIFMRIVEGGCKFPLAAFAKCINNSIHLNAIIGDLDSSRYIRKGILFTIDEYPKAVEQFAYEMKKIALVKKIKLNNPNS